MSVGPTEQQQEGDMLIRPVPIKHLKVAARLDVAVKTGPAPAEKFLLHIKSAVKTM